MHFKSLAVFFQYLQIDIRSLNAETIGRIKKVINAEFAMSENGIIKVDKQSFSKQDIQVVLDAKDSIEILASYQLISENSLFSNFLENGIMDPQIHLEINNLRKSERVLELTSTYTAYQFNKSQRELLQNCRFNNATQEMKLLPMILEKDFDLAFQAIKEYLEAGIYLIKNTNNATHPIKVAEFKRWTMEWAQWANNIPEVFTDLKNDLAIKLINYCVSIQNVDKRCTYFISSQLIKLRFLSTINKQLAYNNHIIYEQKVSDLKLLPKESSQNYNKKWAGIGFFLFIAIIMINQCKDAIQSKNAKDIAIQSYKDNNTEQNSPDRYFEFYASNIFNQFNNFKVSPVKMPLSENLNFISYVYADKSKGGINIQNDTFTDLYLIINYNKKLQSEKLTRGTNINFDYSNGETINFLITSNSNLIGDANILNQLNNVKWIAIKEIGNNVNRNNVILVDTNSVLKLKNPNPPKQALKLKISNSKGINYMHFVKEVEVDSKFIIN